MSAISSDTDRQIARAAGTVMAAFILSNLVGLLRTVLVARAFGTSPEMEAFTPANRVSETLFNLVAGGALASAFIPTFTGLLAKKARGEAWRTASAIANLVFIVSSVACLLASAFAPQVVSYVLAPGFAVDPEKEALTIDLLRLMLPSVAIFSLSGLAMAVLNSHQVFFVPALAPSMYGLGMIFGTLFLAPRMGIYGLAWGVLIGAVLHLAVQMPSLLRLGGSYSLILGLSMPSVREVMVLLVPRLVGVAAVQLNFWVNTRIASTLPEGSVNGITYAFTLMLMPQALIAQSIAIAAMPTFSAQFALGKIDEMRSSLSASLRGVVLLSLPASLGLILLRIPVVELLLQRGSFGPHSTELVAWALLWYAAGLVGHSLVEVLSRAFYSMHDTRTPVLVTVGAMSLNAVLSFSFASLFNRLGWMPHGGLALANTLATALEALVLIGLIRGRLAGLNGRDVLAGVLLSGLATLVMCAGLSLWVYRTGVGKAWLLAAGGVFLGGVIYGLALLAMGVREAHTLLKTAIRWRLKPYRRS